MLADDDGRIWLYSGFYTPTPAIMTGFKKLKNDGGVVVELEQDMVTIKTDPKLISPKEGPDSFPDHEFFEASSIRKDSDQYIANMRDGAVAGFKYFQMEGEKMLSIELRGIGSGKMEISDTPDFINCVSIPVEVQGKAKIFTGKIDLGTAKKALYFKFCGTGAVDFVAFELA